MRARKLNGGKHPETSGLPPELEKALEAHYRQKILQQLLKGEK